MYEKKLPFDIDCGIRIAMEVIGGKWKSCIIFELAEGPKRPSEFHRLFPEANSRVIDQQLKELETCGIIEKKIYARLPPHSEYSITPAGKTLIPVVRQLEQWGNEFRPAMKKFSAWRTDGSPLPAAFRRNRFFRAVSCCRDSPYSVAVEWERLPPGRQKRISP
ncbi:MAG: helix-turn-helix transcriptional regulator [Akkermansia sp.]|nr:helix-turn-helix domain-containing protein [Akkermansia sp.]MBS5509004.1 helix-turn-helix transcriptional regulator [Akkermansia sp.]